MRGGFFFLIVDDDADYHCFIIHAHVLLRCAAVVFDWSIYIIFFDWLLFLAKILGSRYKKIKKKFTIFFITVYITYRKQ